MLINIRLCNANKHASYYKHIRLKFHFNVELFTGNALSLNKINCEYTHRLMPLMPVMAVVEEQFLGRRKDFYKLHAHVD